MDKRYIVNKLLEKGRLVTPEALELLQEENINDVLNFTKDFVVSKTSIKQNKQDTVKILKNFTNKPKEINKEDFISFYTSKYEKMKNIITSRINKEFISINKTGGLRSEVYIIGMVREIREKDGKKTIVVEDMTESKSVIFDQNTDLSEVELDDVVAIKAVAAGEILFGKQVLYPDIPLRQPQAGSGKACFISDLHLDEAPKSEIEKFMKWFGLSDINILFVSGDVGDNKAFEDILKIHCTGKKIFVIPGHTNDEMNYPTIADIFENNQIVSLSNPSMVDIGGVKILLIHNADIEMIKKRYLGKTKLITKEDYLVLDEVPDIVHCGHNHKPHIMNYKSVTFVNAGSTLTNFKPVVIDLKTRESDFINF